ncbi:hypothetical protein CfE428DRAFT_6569 [Chthoniobacter flavus Ellin428]|uniref:Uncharacterized protein n=1 Tax=Chthoniobacter flavus Ellin428 TaxID=497964 RepID=B4DCC8_9BACT|nr:hypothetical protein CfE428DRAFT_6569 [Chthoniobacter flavus Ellin428]
MPIAVGGPEEEMATVKKVLSGGTRTVSRRSVKAELSTLPRHPWLMPSTTKMRCAT